MEIMVRKVANAVGGFVGMTEHRLIMRLVLATAPQGPLNMTQLPHATVACQL